MENKIAAIRWNGGDEMIATRRSEIERSRQDELPRIDDAVGRSTPVKESSGFLQAGTAFLHVLHVELEGRPHSVAEKLGSITEQQIDINLGRHIDRPGRIELQDLVLREGKIHPGSISEAVVSDGPSAGIAHRATDAHVSEDSVFGNAGEVISCIEF